MIAFNEEKAQDTFDLIKNKLICAPLLTLPNFTDASRVEISVVFLEFEGRDKCFKGWN